MYKLSNQTNSLVIQFNKTVYHLYKNQNYFKMSHQRIFLAKTQVRINKVYLVILGNNKTQFKVDHFQDYNLKAIKHNHLLCSDNSNKIKLFNLETHLEGLYLIIIKLYLEFLLLTCSAIRQDKLNSLKQMMRMMMMVLIKTRRMKLPLLIYQTQ